MNLAISWHSKRSVLTDLTLWIPINDFHVLNISSICHRSRYSWTISPVLRISLPALVINILNRQRSLYWSERATPWLLACFCALRNRSPHTLSGTGTAISRQLKASLPVPMVTAVSNCLILPVCIRKIECRPVNHLTRKGFNRFPLRGQPVDEKGFFLNYLPDIRG